MFLIAQSKQKSYVDRIFQDLEFMIVKKKLHKVFPVKHFMRFKKTGKLSLRFISQFEILHHIRELAYELVLALGIQLCILFFSCVYIEKVPF